MFRKEAGQALPLALVLVFLGAAVIIPSLYFSTTNLRVTRTVDEKTREAYAADAGIQDVLWHLQTTERQELINHDDTWPLDYEFDDPDVGREDVNGKDVAVHIDQVWVLGGLDTVDVPDDLPAEDDPANANDTWYVTGAINMDENDTYIVDINTAESASQVYVENIGVWIPKGYEYVDDSVTINGVPGVWESGGNNLVKNPTYQTPLHGGKAIIWTYSNTTFKALSDLTAPPPPGVTPAQRYPPRMRLSFVYTIDPFQEAQGFFPWIKLATGDRIAWDPINRFYHVLSTATTPGTDSHTTIEAYVPSGQSRQVTGAGSPAGTIGGDYIVIGNSLMTECWHNAGTERHPNIVVGPPCNDNYTCSTHCRGKWFSQSSATTDINAVPQDAQIETAYLYWTAWLDTTLGPENSVDKNVTLQVNGTPVGTDGTVTANTWFILPTVAGGSTYGYQYACFANVTDAVAAITTNVNSTQFTVGGVNAIPASTCSSAYPNQSANAGWSMIIIYSSAEVETHQIYLYDQLAYLWGSYGASAEFTILGFTAPTSGNREAKVAYFVAEGDSHITPDYFEFKGQHSSTYVYLGDPGSGDDNYYKNVYNAFSTATGFTPSSLVGQPEGKISGVDLDVYTEDKDHTSLSTIVQPGDTQANILVRTVGSGNGCDGIMVVYVVFSVRSTNVSAGQGFNVGTMMYQFK
jgi:hypothetical protein